MSDRLQHDIDFVRQASEARGDSAERIEERVRFMELLHIHADAGWIKSMVITRLMNFIVNPETWEDWKSRGGDSGFFDGEDDENGDDFDDDLDDDDDGDLDDPTDERGNGHV